MPGSYNKSANPVSLGPVIGICVASWDGEYARILLKKGGNIGVPFRLIFMISCSIPFSETLTTIKRGPYKAWWHTPFLHRTLECLRHQVGTKRMLSVKEDTAEKPGAAVAGVIPTDGGKGQCATSHGNNAPNANHDTA